MQKQKIIIVLGQTASGKSKLAVKLAKKINGEIISADSRQIYKGFDIGTGKITKKEMQNIPHHLLSIVNPKNKFNAAKFKILAEKKIKEISDRGKIPIICGGTGFYIQMIVDNITLPNIKADKKLRRQLMKKELNELFEILEKLDYRRAKNIDIKNKIRLIRAIEIAKSIGNTTLVKNPSEYDILQIGIKLPEHELKKKIYSRLLSRLRYGMLDEAKKLHNGKCGPNLSWRYMENIGLEYKYMAQYLQNKLSKKDMINKLNQKIWQYAKRQMTWFKRDKKIHWFHPREFPKILKLVKKSI